MPSPIYFCPHGVARPEHIAAAGAVETLPAAACGAGFVFGHGGWSDAMAPLLIASPHGWSAIIHGCEARHFLRLRPYDGTVIDGHPQRNDRWMVPLLLRPKKRPALRSFWPMPVIRKSTLLKKFVLLLVWA